MRLFRVLVVVYNLDDERRGEEIEPIVDTGATYPVIPAPIAERLGIRASEEITFTLANGTRLVRKVGWAGLAYDGRKTHTRVIFGVAEDVPLLGAFALEGLGYEVDPIAKALRPATQFLLHEREKRILETEEFIPLDKA
jgi:predicted aspartyl protease